MSTVAPIREPQINNNLYVGASASVRTIQQAVNVAVQQGVGFAVIIPAGYTGSDSIAAVTGGSVSVYLCDQRTASWQFYAWNGTAYVAVPVGDILCGSIPDELLALGSYGALRESQMPTVLSDGESLYLDGGPLGVVFLNWLNGGHGVAIGNGTGEDDSQVVSIDNDGNAVFDGTVTAGDLTAEGDLTADSGNFNTCTVAGSPVRTMANTPDAAPYPPAGVPQSTGSAWDISIPPANLARTNINNNFVTPQSFIGPVVMGGGLDVGGGLSATGQVLVNGLVHASDLTGDTCEIAGSPVRTMANTPDAAPYPPAGVPQSTGSGWSTSLPAANIALLPNANTWPNEQTFGVEINAQGGLSSGGDITATGDLTAAAGSFSGPLTVDAIEGHTLDNPTGDSIYVSAYSGNGLKVGPSQATYLDNYGAVNCVGLHCYSVNAANGDFAGTLNAVQKNFKITDPLNAAQWLTHGSLEGPENGVYYRGEGETGSDGSVEIELPNYFEALTIAEQRTVLLSQIFEDDATDFAQLMVGRVVGGTFRVRSSAPAIKFFWQVNAVRADIPPLQVVTDKMVPEANLPPPPQPPEPSKKESVKAKRKV